MSSILSKERLLLTRRIPHQVVLSSCLEQNQWDIITVYWSLLSGCVCSSVENLAADVGRDSKFLTRKVWLEVEDKSKTNQLDYDN